MFQLDVKSRKSIYEQIVDNFKELIVAGILAPGDKIPSVREMSSTLSVNPNTIQKVYSGLESQGWIYTVAGRGCFVSEEKPQAKDAEKKELLSKLNGYVRQLKFLGMTEDEIIQSIKEGGSSK